MLNPRLRTARLQHQVLACPRASTAHERYRLLGRHVRTVIAPSSQTLGLMSLLKKPILIVDNEIDAFVRALHIALVDIGVETLIALDEASAIEHATRIKFSAVMVGSPPHFTKDFVEAFGGVPVIFYGRPSNIVPFKKTWVAVHKDVPEILRSLVQVLRTR